MKITRMTITCLKIHSISISPLTTLSKRLNLHQIRDANTYCDICDTWFSNREGYKRHMLECCAHKVNHVKNNSTNPYCAPCKKFFKNRITYSRRLQKVHDIKFTYQATTTSNNDTTNTTANVIYPIQYCKPCKKVFYNQFKFSHHLCTVMEEIPLLQQTKIKQYQ